MINKKEFEKKAKRRGISKNIPLLAGGGLVTIGLIAAAIIVPSVMSSKAFDFNGYVPKGTEADMDDPNTANLVTSLEKEVSKTGNEIGEFKKVIVGDETISFIYKNNDVVEIFKEVLKDIDKDNENIKDITKEKSTTTIEFDKNTGFQKRMICDFTGSREWALIIKQKDTDTKNPKQTKEPTLYNNNLGKNIDPTISAFILKTIAPIENIVSLPKASTKSLFEAVRENNSNDEPYMNRMNAEISDNYQF